MTQTIAHTIYRFIKRQLNLGGQRKFFRVDGFEDSTYQNLIQRFQQDRFAIDPYTLLVRSTAPIEGFQSFAVEAHRSATWYRNHVSADTALVLLFNRPTSDAQSLKDLYTITETTLASEGIDDLFAEVFHNYTLAPASVEALKKRMRQIERHLFKPQLRDLADFLDQIRQYMYNHHGASIEEAIAHSLPALGMFRYAALATLDQQKSTRALKDIYRASRLGAELIDDRQLAKYLHQIERVRSDTSSGLTANSIQLIERFLTTIISEPALRQRIYALDWEDVAPIFQKASARGNAATLKNLEASIQSALVTKGIEPKTLPESDRDFLKQLGEGVQPQSDDIERFADEYGDMLAVITQKKLHNLVAIKPVKQHDFMVGVAQAVATIMATSGQELTAPLLRVISRAVAITPANLPLIEAVQAFRTLHGGIEQRIPSIQWNFTTLDAALADIHRLQPASDSRDHEDQPLLSGKATLEFQLELTDAQYPDTIAARVPIVWTYQVSSAQALTVASIRAEQSRSIDEMPMARIPIPLYYTNLSATKIADFDLSQPLRSIGIWYTAPSDLRTELKSAIGAQTSPDVHQQLDNAVLRLERTWARVINIASNRGMLAAPLDELMAAYAFLIDKAGALLQADQEHVPGLRIINRAWLIGPEQFDDWAIVPFLHPFKIQWWHSRASTFNTLIQRLIDPAAPARAVDQERLLQELSSAYSSANNPAVLALTQKGVIPDFYLPVQEFMGYELYRVSSQASIAHGFSPELVSDAESDQTVKQAAMALAAVVEDYLETYPFVRDGLEIYIIRCRNGALPGTLVEQITKRLERSSTRLRLNVIVHTDRGAPIHEHVAHWLRTHEEFQERVEDTYFPRISLKVRHCTFEELLETVEDTDMVILPDVIAERGQSVVMRTVPAAPMIELPIYLSRYGAYQTPHQHKEYTRDIVLTQPQAPHVHQSFYRLQEAAHRRGRMHDPGTMAEAVMRVTLQDWQQELDSLHREFNWVVCYDAVVDRFLLEATFPQTIDIIRYSLGLGPKRRHNLTVSSSNKTRAQVRRRLMVNLSTMLGSMPHEQQQTVAEQLIVEANRISGDIVLRAAGPGAFLNELIGMVAARADIERDYRARHPDAWTTWIYLEDFSQWFKKRLPDLLFIAIRPGQQAPITLDMQVIETKCVSQNSFPGESKEARDQVIHGLNRLQQIWRPGAQHLDADYWYDQLYQALAGTISLPASRAALWNRVRDAIPVGNFELNINAHTWVYCHDGEVAATSAAGTRSGDGMLYMHHYGAQHLRATLKNLAQMTGLPDAAAASSGAAVVAGPHPIVQPLPAATPAAPARVSDPAPEVRGAAAPPPAASPSRPQAQNTQAAADPQLLEQEPDAMLRDWLEEKRQNIMRAMRHYSINITPIDSAEADIGPSIVRFKLRTRPGEKLSRLQAIADDLQRELALSQVPLIDNVPGTNYIGLDIPRLHPDPVDLLNTLGQLPMPELGQLRILAGTTPNGQVVIPNLTEMPHMLVAGTTGSGKTVFLYSIIVSLLHQFGPDQLELLLVDPKQTDFVYFDGLPHLFEGSVIIDPTEAIEKLKLLTSVQLEERTAQLRGARCRDIQSYNAAHRERLMRPIVVIIDEYADLVQVLSKPARMEFEAQLIRLAQRARNVGIHLVVATQRPSADVLTTTLKTNLACRVAFRLPSHHDSQIVLDRTGAENLIGKGDMLYTDQGTKTRLQGLLVQNHDLEAWLRRRPWRT